MDYWGALHELREELQRIDRVIVNLELLAEEKPLPCLPVADARICRLRNGSRYRSE